MKWIKVNEVTANKYSARYIKEDDIDTITFAEEKKIWFQTKSGSYFISQAENPSSYQYFRELLDRADAESKEGFSQ